ncbi:MAG: ABC transporter permease, partial [Bacteroidia bacterium]|nr:ABC transporter permease [Bacteroidia bacterium]
MLKRLIYESGNWEMIQMYYHQLQTIESFVYQVPKDSSNSETLLLLKAKIVELKEMKQPEDIPNQLFLIHDLAIQLQNQTLISEIQKAKQFYNTIYNKSEIWKTWIPWIHFHGFQNQYHIWLLKLLQFDFGTSYIDRRPITNKLPEAIRWSLILNLLSIILSYIVSIPIGIYSATHRNTPKERMITAFLFVLYSLPGFWVATMLILFFGGGDYLAWFPSNGVQSTMHSETWSFGKRLADWAYHLILPTFCYTYGSFAFLSRQMRVGMLDVLNQDYIRTARAKGLFESSVIWKHAFRNSLIPIITLFANIFPAMIGGSVILETIFTIPGMGFLSYQAIVARDYPVMIAVFTISGILTLTG